MKVITARDGWAGERERKLTFLFDYVNLVTIVMQLSAKVKTICANSKMQMFDFEQFHEYNVQNCTNVGLKARSR